jgi:PAS domain S-box-containing protein
MSLATSHPDHASALPGDERSRASASSPAALASDSFGDVSSALALLLQAPVAMAVWAGREHVFAVVNAQFCGLVGRSESALLGKTVRALFSDSEHSGSIEQALDRVWSTAQPVVLAFGAPPASPASPAQPGALAARLAGFELRLAPAFSASGELSGVSAVLARGEPAASARDENDREQRLALALEAGKMGTWEWLITENRVLWSPALERMHGIPVGSFAGTFEAYQSDIHPEDRERVLDSVRQLLAERGAHELEYRIVVPGGAIRWLHAHGRLLLDDAGAPLRLVGVCRDVTEEKDAEAARARVVAAEVASAEAERSRRTLASILESISDPFAVLDEELRVTFVNQAALALRGAERDSMLGKRPWELTPISQDGIFARAYRKVLEERTPLCVEDYLPGLDRWLEANIYPQQRGIAVYTRDITAKKRAEQLRERLSLHAALRADVSSALSSAHEPSAVLQLCCDALVRHLGVGLARVWTLDEGADSLELRASAGLDAQLDRMQRSVPVGQSEIGRIAVERKPHLSNDLRADPSVSVRDWAASEGLVAFAGYPLSVDERLLGVLAVLAPQPLTEDSWAALAAIADTLAQGMSRRRAERALEERVKDLARSNAELEQFAYVASHDLQEPLRMVASYNQLLARRYRGKLDADADEFIDFTVEGVTRMQRLIHDLLAYSRVGTRGRDFAAVDTAAALRVVLQGLTRAIEEAHAVIHVGPLPLVFGDDGQLMQLLQNLIGNAIKFRGDGRPVVNISAEEQEESWSFRVQDNGIGIDPAYFERIFVIFQRLHPRESYPGTGIGLALCKKIVERHAGKIWVESRPGGGSSFCFTLPKVPSGARRVS